MSKISKKSKDKDLKAFGDHHTFLSRITKTLYYGKLPKSDRLSLPVTELATELFSEAKIGKSLERLHCNDAAAVSRNACISPCSFILAMLYLERLKTYNNDYLQRVNPSELFLVSLMVSSKFLYDDGEDDEVFLKDWAISGKLSEKKLVQLESEFLNAINWNVFVSEVTFWKKLRYLERIIAQKQGRKRGWFTYTELQCLLTIDIFYIYEYIAPIFIVLLATYMAGIITILGSIFIVSQIPGNCLQPSSKAIDSNDTAIVIANDSICQNEIMTNMERNMQEINEYKCKLFDDAPFTRKQIDAVDVLKTGLILATLKSATTNPSDSNKSYYESDIKDDENNEKISWDWWTSPTMNWLTSTSELAQKFNFMPNFKDYIYMSYTDVAIVTSKLIKQEDHVDKATQTRIQDQLERSWHKEWTDTIKNSLFDYEKPFQLLKNLKS